MSTISVKKIYPSGSEVSIDHTYASTSLSEQIYATKKINQIIETFEKNKQPETKVKPPTENERLIGHVHVAFENAREKIYKSGEPTDFITRISKVETEIIEALLYCE